MAVIETKSLCKDYHLQGGVVHAVIDADLKIDAGEFVAVMGTSGSGKSTFLHVIGCLDRPSAGEYLFEGQPANSFSADQRAKLRNERIGFVFQSFNLLPRLTALENVEVPQIYGRRKSRQRQQAGKEALQLVGLGDRMDHLPTQLSGGQQQRVAIARALVNQPSVILADEPTGALDTRTGIEIMALLQSLNDDGITIVLVTHEPDVAAFTKRIVRFRDGRIIADEINKKRRDAIKLMNQTPEPEVAS